MSKGIQFILKSLVLVIALGLLSGYVWTRHRAVATDTNKTPALSSGEGFPITPASPTLFDTSKSGKLAVDPVLFSTSKSGPVDLVSGGRVDISSPVFISGSKSINMPVFNTRDFVRLRDPDWPPISQVKKWKNKIDELIYNAERGAYKFGK